MSRKEITDKTLGEIRSLLDEFSNGTSRYESLRGLTDQVEHQYHGRFLIELIQNAHDALFEASNPDDLQRIEIALAENEHPYGALYIANDGQPFTSSNFKALSNLGQSDKDPQKSIGNKGIGFRSVLEITKAPEVYSRKEKGSSSFDGYCFRFQPDVIQMFEEPIQRVIDGDNSVEAPEIIGGQLLEWDDARYKHFRDKCRSSKKGGLHDELTSLSPYALPIPIEPRKRGKVKEYEERGFSTVVRLPFLNDQARKVANRKLEEINESTAIFLHRVNAFRITGEKFDRLYNRKQTPRNNDHEEGIEIQIMADDLEDQDRRYWLWKKTIGGEDNPDEKEDIRSAVEGLPGKWPEVDEATVEIAVRVSHAPDDGMINIYLPTGLPSGCSAHFSAPFFGDMSRTHINFENPLNSLLLETLAEKGTDIILNSLSGKGEAEATAIIDMLAPTSNDDGERWWSALEKVFSSKGIEIKNQDIVLSDKGWDSFSNTFLLPASEKNKVIDADMLRSEATYPVFVQAVQERKKGIVRVFKEIGIGSIASQEDRAETLEAIAKKLHESPEPVDWNGFWHDVEILLDGDTEPLVGKKILLGADNQLHACNEQCSVFFRPRSGGSDDEVLADGGVDDIPEKLRPYIAFLNEDIQTHTPSSKGGITTTSVQKYLSSGLVESYGVERIFSSVLVKATPNHLHGIRGSKAKLCRDILQWGLKLLKASKGSMDEPIRFLGGLLAPCIGGWYPISETSFGPGWLEKRGTELEAYLRRVNTPECRSVLKNLLLPPDDPLWGGIGESSIDILEKAGVFDGIRLIRVTDKDWNGKFTMAQWTGVKLPEETPPGYGSDIWNTYREYIKNNESPPYSGEFNYEVQNVYALPGFKKLEKFDYETRDLLMKLLLVSIPSWNMRWKNWKRVRIRKINGEDYSFYPDSPLVYSLMFTEWMQGIVGDKVVRFRPFDRWYIPPDQQGQPHQFSHLMPVSVSIASMLSRNYKLIASMKDLGMPCYNRNEETADARLLNDLAKAWQDPSIDISNQSVFLGQVRAAWGQFHPDEESIFPESVVVRNGPGPLKTVTPLAEDIVYLPNATVAIHRGLEMHSKQVIVMEPRDAKRLQDYFQSAYGSGIHFASDLTTRALVDGEQWQKQNNATQLSEDIPWLIPIVLSVFAFSGERSHGSGTNTFAKATDSLRKARIVWVDSLEVGLWHGGNSVARTSVPALWLPEESILLAKKDAQDKVSLLSETLASIVDRGDIDVSLKLVLGECERAGEITEDVVYEALEKLHITIDHYQEVQQRWLGDLAWKIRLVRPLILLMQPNADVMPLDEISSEDEFENVIQLYDLSPISIGDVLSEAASLREIGYKAWKIIPDRAQLIQWNKVISQLGESLVINDQAADQFQEHIYSFQKVMRSIIRYTICQHPESRKFKDMEDEFLSLECPMEYEKSYWIVDFHHVMIKVCDILQGWNTSRDVVALVKNTTNAEGLRKELDKLGLEPDIDPIEINSDNQKMFFCVLERIKKIAIAWCIKEDANHGIWGEDSSIIKIYLADDFEKSAFLEIWNEAMCLNLLGKLDQPQIHEEFKSALNMSSSINELMNKLGISNTDLTKAHEKLEKRKQERKLREKTVEVCGRDFVNSEDNLNNLWEHILKTIGDDSVVGVDLNNLESLKKREPVKKRKKDNKNPTKMTKTPGRKCQALKDLVGLVGEIHAFRALQKFYGGENVGPDNWKSENSRYKYPENTANDGLGCDFVIHNEDGNIHYVEVKATQAENEAFELGSSEAELAINSANRRKKNFVILHVLNALDNTPSIRILPNPYDERYKDKYYFEEAGLRVRYKMP